MGIYNFNPIRKFILKRILEGRQKIKKYDIPKTPYTQPMKPLLINVKQAKLKY